MGRHKTSAVRAGGTHMLPTGARLVASVAVAAAGVGALAAALVPAGAHPGLHEAFPRTAHAGAARPAPADGRDRLEAAKPAAAPRPSGAAQPAPDAQRKAVGATGTARRAVGAVAGDSSQGSPAGPSAAEIKRLNALQKELDSTSPAVVLRLVNKARAQAGSPPLKLSANLGARAEQAVKALPAESGQPGTVEGMPGQPAGSSDASTDASVASFSRNEVGAQAAVNDWLKDPTGRANLLDPAFRTMGVASTTNPVVIWWAHLLGK
ncbi:CAP domain-containing protein [Streptomyces sp. H27-H1]|uniref:CAP domain-containing protein n=1 Tax=Streptomyces sp. H27-H1 TaxID=2996461 RepID=UPI00227098C4|nr:CAP domain-containing protein [Streptomyces sp. H27-H1]MCY0932165.1 CAP domain-containing protein [Streptomyces sp. H27-H1]